MRRRRRRSFNGATLSRTWKRSLKLTGNANGEMLQWSHAQPNVETMPSPSRAIRSWRFNGATLSRTWKLPPAPRDAVFHFNASMEPRSAERGNLEKAVLPVVMAMASMEPRSAERGNKVYPSFLPPFAGCFNGATLSRTWKPAAARRPRRGRPASMEPRSAERGNAPTIRVWSLLPSEASMEPRSAERGNANPQVPLRYRCFGFNGATLSRTWKPPSPILGSSRACQLQWSHAQPNVETPCRVND